MRRFKFAKLVRDKIVDSIVTSGGNPDWRVLSDNEYIEELKKKILEEAQEIPLTQSDSLVGELADIQEVVDTLLQVLNVSKDEFEKVQKSKTDKAGSFKNRQYIETVETKDDNKWIDYYLSSPDKYPEIK